jgi:transcriptional regulator with XRE-family HTH domain
MAKRSPHDDEITLEVGRRLKSARLRKEMSQQRVAELAGLDRTTIGLIERGKHGMLVSTLMLICGAMEIDPYEICGGIEYIAGPEPPIRTGTWVFNPPPRRPQQV